MAIPVVTAAPKQGVAFGGNAAASTLFSASDADGQAVTQYQLWDGGTGGGFFTVGGITQAAGTAITVTDLSNVQYVAGGSLGSETLFARALAGGEFSAWQQWSMYTLAAGSTAPTVAAPDFKNSGQD